MPLPGCTLGEHPTEQEVVHASAPLLEGQPLS
jgi:hypothetical protein